ncbi:unnamed protein product [Durusdinium trenchii]|uniref:Pentatricopeptide repeat-containing protein, chloroplastic n=1 Tax=Durusdinium trenchii TaxID=1381693 RepID=A0ABP0Q5Y9_9DINO
MDLAPNIHLAHKLPNGMDFFNPEFGPACTSGFKVLCGPKGSPTAPGVWMPSCGGTCPQSCSDKTPWPVCQDLTYSSSLAQVDPEHFGPECTTGRRARCGVTGSTVFPYWWGGPDDNTKPGLCTGMGNICNGIQVYPRPLYVCITGVRNVSEIPDWCVGQHYAKYFGLPCAAGSPGYKVEVKVSAFNAAITGCEKSRWWTKALALFAQIDQVQLEEAALDVFENLCSWHLERTLDGRATRNVVSYGAALSAYEKGQKWEMALELLEDLHLSRIQGNLVTACAAISACETGAAWIAALSLLEEVLSQLQADVISFSAAMSACEKSSQWERAMRLLALLREHAVQETVITCNSVISACEKAGRWQMAWAFLEELHMRQIRATIVTFSAAISACEKGGQWHQAMQALGQLSSLEGSLLVPSNAAIRSGARPT